MSTLAAILPMAINWAPSPEIFSIGPIHIRYYSVLFVSGFIIGYYIFVKFFKREGLPVEILDMLLYTLLGSAVVGARLFMSRSTILPGRLRFLRYGKEVLPVMVVQ